MRTMADEFPLTQPCNGKPASFSSPTMSTVFELMGRAMKFPLNNKKLMLQVFIFSLSPFLLLVLLHYQVISPFTTKVEDGYENSSLNHQDIVSLVALEIPVSCTFCLVLLFSSAITISASTSTHQGKSLGMIEMLLYLKSKWNIIFVSGLCCSFLLTVFIGVTIILMRLTALMGVLVVFTYPYLASICFIMLVISTTEDEYQVKEGFRRAREIIIWRRFLGYRLMLVLILMNIPVYVVLYVTLADDDDENGLITQSTFLLGSTVLFCLTYFYSNVVFTLFYLDFKQVNVDRIEEQGSKYISVPTLSN